MAYTPVEGYKGPNVRVDTVDSIEPCTGNMPSSLDRDTYDVDSKGAFQSSQAPVGSWPVQAQQVAPMTPLRGFLMVFDTILASTPIMFIALALTAARLNGKDVSEYGERLKETLLLSPTIFPLIFAALMGRFFRHLGVYLAERGTTLGRLEQLIGCQSVFSALERQFCLRSWSLVGLLSILVWLLSPVGGQSALRLLDTKTKDVASTATVLYMDPMTIVDSFMSGASGRSSTSGTYTSIFHAALLSSSKYQNTPMDLWGNVKLPRYRTIENSTSDEWKVVSNITWENATYASLVGIPVTGLPKKGYSNFTIKARQFDFTCSSNEMKTNKTADFGSLAATWKFSALNSTNQQKRAGSPLNPVCKGYPCPIVSKSRASDDEANDQRFSVAKCDLSFDYFEAGVRCNGASCAVHTMRKLDMLQDGYTKGLDIYGRNNFLSTIISTFPILDNYQGSSLTMGGSTNMEKWMMDPSSFIGLTNEYVDLWQLPPKVFAERLTIIWNSFWQSTYGTTALGGSLPKNIMQTHVLADRSSSNVTFNGTAASIVEQTGLVYQMDWRWFAALLGCSLVLLVAAYAGLVLKYITLAPDILGYASSLTLLNPYVTVPTGGTTLHGLERTALLRDLKIRIGDVCGDEATGAIAFGRADETVGRLERNRMYI